MLGDYVFKKKVNFAAATVLDFFAYPLVQALTKKNNLFSNSPKNILFVRLDHLGDCLLACGVPEILKKSFNGSKVTILTSSLGKNIFLNNPFIDEILVFDLAWYRRKNEKITPQSTYKKMVQLLRGKGFDLGLAPRGDIRENRLLFDAHIPHRVGYGITGGGFFLNHEISYRRGLHESEHTLDVLRSVGIKADALAPRIYFSDMEDKEIPVKLSQLGVDLSKPYFGLQLDAGASSKDWPEENVKNFLKLFSAEFPAHKMVWVGSDKTRASRLEEFVSEEGISGSFVNLVGKTSLRELFFLLKSLKVFIGPDSGPTHVAASMGVRTIFLYSGTNVFEEWKSLSKTAHFLREKVSCAPCHLTACPVQGHPCLSNIKADAVIAQLRQVLGGSRDV